MFSYHENKTLVKTSLRMRLFSLVPTKTEDGTRLIKIIIIPVVLVFVVSIVWIVLYCRYVEISYPDIMSTGDLGTSQD